VVARDVRKLIGAIQLVRAQPWASVAAMGERWRERAGGYPELDHRTHLEAAAAWLCAAQDAAGDGIARGYSLHWNPYFRARGWQPAYPETTGYIIPTLFQLADHLDRTELAECALRAARWEIAVQLPSGAVQGGVIGESVSPAVFNTGQVILGWLAAFERTGDQVFADAARRAGRFLVDALGTDGLWRKGHSQFAIASAALYNARTAWALAEAGGRLNEPTFGSAAHRHLRAVAALQQASGWLPDCCLNDPARPLLHTLAYAVRGLLEGGRVLHDDALLECSVRAAAALAARVGEDGWMAGRFAQDWRPAADWSCLTGEAQMANNWMRLFHVTGDGSWLRPVPRVISFVKRTQNRVSADAGLRGGIKGSAPVSGEYGRYQVLSWATKYFADALVRLERLTADPETAGRLDLVLA
jgi:uncharacterized protein YyaL (SSP411 family)